jgi:hypothetical protein
VRSCKDVTLEHHAIHSDGYAEARFWKRLYQGSGAMSGGVGVRVGGTTNLIAPAATLGPNHCPTSVPRSFPARAIRCTLNGALGEGVSKNQVRICTYIT